LCQDRNAAYVTTFQTVFPNLVLSQKWIQRLANTVLPEKRPFDNYRWDMGSPQEEEFAILNLQPYSYYKFYIFPKDYDRIWRDELPFFRLDDRVKETWKARYLELIRKAMIHTQGSRYIGKNPCNIYRISELRAMFPNAKFIFIYRNPYKVTESLYGFSHSIIPGIQLQSSDGLPDRERIVNLYKETMEHYFRVRSEINPANLMEFSYEEMLKDIPGKIKEIYEKFGIDGFDRVLPSIRNYLDNLGMEDRKPLVISEEIREILDREAGAIFRELGYPPGH
jgi:hypothetical protein